MAQHCYNFPMKSVDSNTRPARFGLPTTWLQTAWRALGRDWRAGQLRFLFLALLVASMAVACTGFLSGRVQQAFTHRTAQMIGGDVVLQANNPIAPDIVQAARTRGLALAHSQELSTMASTAQAMRLVVLGPGGKRQFYALACRRSPHPFTSRH